MNHLANALASTLCDLSVRHAFGMPGGATLPLIESFKDNNIDFVLTRHEGSAGFMADAVFQLTGNIGVCVSTLGPGATNLLSGIAQAYLERSRILGLIGLCDETIEPIYTHQILSHRDMFSSVCGYYHRIHPNQPEAQLRTVFRHLLQDAPMPVVLELSRSTALSDCRQIKPEPVPKIYAPPKQALLEHLQTAKRPVIFVGSGDLSMETSREIKRLASLFSIPVMTTYRAKGMIPESDDWSIGAAGLSPVVDAHQQDLLTQCDLIVGIGLDPVELRPNWLPGWPENIPFVGLSTRGQPDLTCPMALDLRGSVHALLQSISTHTGASLWTTQEVFEHKKVISDCFNDEDTGPATAVRAIQVSSPADTILCLDVGAHRITASHVWQCSQPRQILQSNGFSSMGVGLPYAIAARLSSPERPVIALTGDMGLWMCLGELGIVQERNLDLIVVYFSDASLSLIELKQERAGLTNSGVRFCNPDVSALAKAFGGVGVTVEGADNISTAIDEALNLGGLWLVEVIISPQPYRKQM